MIRNRKFGKVGLGAILASASLAGVLTLGSSVAGATMASAQQTTTVSVSPAFISGAGCTSGCTVTVTWQHAHKANAGNLVLVECNYNVFTGDQTACNQDPSNLDQPGGPWIPSDQKSNGSAQIQLETGTVGDGTCDGGQVCAVILANINTQAPIANPAPFGVTP
jgi:hypothetical protein